MNMSGVDFLYEVNNLEHHYGERRVLSIDELSIRSGAVLGLVGPNGSGKSTLLRILAALEPLQRGEVLFKGKSVLTNSLAPLRKEVSLLLQESYLLKRTVFDNVAYGLRIRGEEKSLESRVNDALERVGLSAKTFALRHWCELSGGEIQRVALASRLVLRPSLLLLDEPTANVDERSSRLIKDAVNSVWKEWGTSIVVSTHDASWLNEVATDICCLFSGKIVGNEVVNILPAEWEGEPGRWCFDFSSGQRLFSSYPGDARDSVSVISPASIMVEPLQSITDRNMPEGTLCGTVTHLYADNVQRLWVQIAVGDAVLRACYGEGNVASRRIFPGERVCVRFSDDALKWHSLS